MSLNPSVRLTFSKFKRFSVNRRLRLQDHSEVQKDVGKGVCVEGRVGARKAFGMKNTE